MKPPPCEDQLTLQQAKELLKTAYLHLEPQRPIRWRFFMRRPANAIKPAEIVHRNLLGVLRASYQSNSRDDKAVVVTPTTSAGKPKAVKCKLDPNRMTLNTISRITAGWKRRNKTLFQCITVFLRWARHQVLPGSRLGYSFLHTSQRRLCAAVQRGHRRSSSVVRHCIRC